ncbi:protein FAM184A isoform X4 [Cryptotermes secundus]|uniref:protein FAM184A isoform X4 n=1 Tax=Cryptotermes secundus TaxID=105785 RepID=UPI000CD7C9E7|nr:protein FAM184A isoform X4 [Cryptotermes secundus]
MFNFFKKFKPVSDADGDGKAAKEKTASSLATPARRRDDKAKDKSSSQEREVGVSSFDTKKTDLAASVGAKKKDSEWKFGEAKEPVSIQQYCKKTGPVTFKADETRKEKPHLQNTSRASVMGNTTATMTSLDEGGEIGKSRDLAKCPATYTNTEHKEKHQYEAAEAAATADRRNLLMSRATPADLTMVIKTQVEEQLTEENELTQKMPESEPSPGPDENFTTSEKQMERLEHEKRNLVSQEARFQEQLAELTAQLTARDNESNKLRYQMEDLQRDVLIKSCGMDRLQAELAAAHKESECVRRRMRQLEEDLGTFKEKNRELEDELQKKAEEMHSSSNNSGSDSDNDSDSERVAELESKVNEMEEKVQQLQSQLEEVRSERDKLEQTRVEMEADREEEIKIIERALEEALEEKALILARFEQDFEKLRTVNTDREQQLLDDFEWKLREVEQACKRRLEEKDKAAEERLKEGKKELELKLKLAEQQLQELPQLKTYEAEVIQLRGLTIEQQRSLRVTTRQTEQLQVSERLLKEEVTRLRGQLDKEKSHGICMQSLHEKKMADNEKKFEIRLDQQKSEITAQWEDRLRQECSRLKSELDQLHSEEKHLAVESVKVQKEQEMRTAKQNWERRLQECLKEISTLKDRLTEKDTYYHGELEKAQTNADRDIFDLRRKLDKLDLSYQDQLEKLTEKYEKEIDIQWERLMNEKEKAVADLEEKHQTQVELIKAELEKTTKNSISRENEQLLEVIANLKKQLQGQTAVISDLQGNVDLLQGGMQVLNQEISTQNVELQRIQTQTTHKLREREAQLEVEQQRKVAELKDQFAAESKQWQEQMKALKDQSQQKLNYLAKLVQESEEKYKNRESHKEDTDLIAHLKQALEEREHEIACLTEEKRFYQLELMNHESTYNHLFSVQPITGVMDPLHHHRKKGLKSPSRQHQLHPPKAQRWQVTASSVPALCTHSNTSHRKDFIVQKSKSLEPSMIHIKQDLHGKVAETSKPVCKDKSHQVMSPLDHVSNLVSTTENSTVETCGLQSIETTSNFNSVPDQIVCSGTSESLKSDKLRSVQGNSDQIMADLSSITNCESAVSQDCPLTFNAVDVPDSRMSILLQSHKSAERSKISNSEIRSKSVETAANEVRSIIIGSVSTPTLQ